MYGRDYGNNGDGIPEAPIDGKQYGREDAAWSEVTGGTGTGLHADLTDTATDGHPANIVAVTLTATNYTAATADVEAHLTGIDTALGNKQASGTYSTDIHSNISALDDVSGSNTGDETDTTIKTKLGVADTDSDGYLSSTDWNTFNGKENALTFTATDFDRSTNTISIDYTNAQKASTSNTGFLTNTDWNTFNGKMANPMTASGDIIYGGTSGAATTLAKGDDGKYLKLVSGLPSWQDVSAGGLTNFTEAVNTDAPNATVPVCSIIANNAATNVDVCIGAKGTGAILMTTPDNTSTGGNKRGVAAVDLQRYRSAASEVASGSYSIAMGLHNTAAGNYTAAIGYKNTAQAAASIALGTGSKSYLENQIALGRLVSGKPVGRHQISDLLLTANTTDATTYRMDNGITYFQLPIGGVYAFTITIVARKDSNITHCASWKRYGLVAATESGVVQQGSTLTLGTDIINSNMTGCGVNVYGGSWYIYVNVTGLASTNISWTARVELTEVGA